MKYTIASGNAFSGVRLIGIFNDEDIAIEYAEANVREDDWSIIPIEEQS